MHLVPLNTDMTNIEIFGYLASATVALSLMLKNHAWLRAINGVGASLFIAYGVMIHSKPVVVLNGFIAVADFYYLWKMLQTPAETLAPATAKAPASHS